MYHNKYLKYKTKYIGLKKIINDNNSDPKTNKKTIKTNDLITLIPSVSKTNKVLNFYFPEISIASVQYDAGPTGCTYVRFNVENDIHYYVDSRGGATTTYAADISRSNRFIRGICFSGGSILGLEAITGCVIEEVKKTGYSNFSKCIVTGAMLRSANLDHNLVYPDKNLGRFAVKNVKKNKIYMGQAGAGLMAGDGFYGQGAAFSQYKQIKIFVLSAVNALGALFSTNGEKLKDRNELSKKKNKETENTTLTTIITDLKLDHTELKQLAIQCHTNMAVVIRPFHTIGDGDVLFSITLNKIDKNDIDGFDTEEFYKICSELTKEAVLNCL